MNPKNIFQALLCKIPPRIRFEYVSNRGWKLLSIIYHTASHLPQEEPGLPAQRL